MADIALYYPNWSIDSPRFLCESLLYWDRLACIVPYKPYKDSGFDVWFDDAEMRKAVNEAHNRYVTPCVLTTKQKRRAHEKIKFFAEHVAPLRFKPKDFRARTNARISMSKLASRTVDLLHENEWMRSEGGTHLAEVDSAVANLIMAALAEECSSGKWPCLTEDPGGFTASCNLVLTELRIDRGLVVEDPGGERVDPFAADRSFLLEGIPHLSLDQADNDPRVLQALLAACEKSDVVGLRKAFRASIDEFLERLREAELPERQAVRDHFRNEVDRDLAKLKKELLTAGLKAIFTKEGFAAIAVGLATGAATSPTAGVFTGLVGGLLTYQKARREELGKHWTGWLFAAEHPRFSLL